jgi:tRNA1Val (adenine37-N6)-methyltransferase
MKVGTDAVVLGAWVNIGEAKTILDIGTGCGVIALMLAQRASGAKVDAVEIDNNSSEEAACNFKNSPFAERLQVHNTSIQEYHHEPYDLIVSNPPFFNNSLLPPTTRRKLARHTTTLSYDDLFKSAARLLSPGGRFAVIVPGKEIIDIAKRHGLECQRITAVYPRKRLERWLFEFSRNGKMPVKEQELVLYGPDDRWSIDYRNLTRDFYLYV